MPQFIISYLGGNPPATPEQGEQRMVDYKNWLNKLGDQVTSPMNPILNTHTVNSDGSVENNSATAMMGFTVIEADSIEAALLIAKNCPFLQTGGSLEVSELVKMPDH